MNTQENNKMIAEFMGMKYSDKRSFNDGEWTHSIKSLSQFQTSWNWLMPVVDKIESFQDGEDGDSMRGHLYNFRIEQYFVYILDGESMDVIIEMNGDSKRDATYNAVVEFINQYNKNKWEYKTCDRCSYDILDEEGDVLEHHCIDDELYNPIQ